MIFECELIVNSNELQIQTLMHSQIVKLLKIRTQIYLRIVVSPSMPERGGVGAYGGARRMRGVREESWCAKLGQG